MLSRRSLTHELVLRFSYKKLCLPSASPLSHKRLGIFVGRYRVLSCSGCDYFELTRRRGHKRAFILISTDLIGLSNFGRSNVWQNSQSVVEGGSTAFTVKFQKKPDSISRIGDGEEVIGMEFLFHHAK